MSCSAVHDPNTCSACLLLIRGLVQGVASMAGEAMAEAADEIDRVRAATERGVFGFASSLRVVIAAWTGHDANTRACCECGGTGMHITECVYMCWCMSGHNKRACSQL